MFSQGVCDESDVKPPQAIDVHMPLTHATKRVLRAGRCAVWSDKVLPFYTDLRSNLEHLFDVDESALVFGIWRCYGCKVGCAKTYCNGT